MKGRCVRGVGCLKGVCVYQTKMTISLYWALMLMDSNPSPPRIKAQERDANGHSYSSNPVKVGQSRKVDLTKPGAYSKQIETPLRDLWVHKYQYLH